MNVIQFRYHLVLVVASLGMAQSVHAEPPLSKTVTAPVVTPTAPLKGALKLAPLTTPVPVVPPPDNLAQAYDRFKAIAERARTARDNYAAARDQCAVRSFSVQDQRQAGCQESDTVAQCNARLESWCTSRESRAFVRQNRLLQRAAQELKSATDSYIAEARRLPEGD